MMKQVFYVKCMSNLALHLILDADDHPLMQLHNIRDKVLAPTSEMLPEDMRKARILHTGKN